MQVVIVLVAIIATSLIGLVNPLLLKLLIDDVIVGGQYEKLNLYVGLMILLPIVTGLIGVGQSYLNNLIGQNVMQDLRNALYAHLQRMPLRFFTATRTGEIQSRLSNDVGGVQAVVTDTAASITSNVAVALSTMVAMFLLSWQLTLLSLGMLPFFLYLTYRVGKVRREVSGETQKRLAEMSAVTEETLSVSGILLGKTFGAQERSVVRFQALNLALAKLQSGADLNFKALASALLAMLEGRHLQIAVDDPAAAALLSERGWDGGFRRSRDEDFLAVVDSNVGFNKANAAVNQEIAYRVAPAAAGDRIEASLTLTYTHTAVPLSPSEPCDYTPRYGDSYDDLIRRCYRDYLRVYVPSGSELMDAGGLANLTSAAGEGGTTGFAGDFELRPGAQHVVTLRYRLPARLAAEPYRLSVRKQAGTGPAPLWVKGGECRWATALDSDRRFECPVVGQ